MGSHGGGTAEGQLRVLTPLGITEEALGAPVLSSMEVVELGRTPGGFAVYLDRNAAYCDGIVVVNRIKPHTAFVHRFGSGLLKMLAIGLGKAQGAAQAHRLGADRMPQCIEEVARALLATGRIVGGVTIVENAYDETAAVEVLPPAAIPEREPILYEQAQRGMPRLPGEGAGGLVVERRGGSAWGGPAGLPLSRGAVGGCRPDARGQPAGLPPPAPGVLRLLPDAAVPAAAGPAQPGALRAGAVGAGGRPARGDHAERGRPAPRRRVAACAGDPRQPASRRLPGVRVARRNRPPGRGADRRRLAALRDLRVAVETGRRPLRGTPAAQCLRRGGTVVPGGRRAVGGGLLAAGDAGGLPAPDRPRARRGPRDRQPGAPPPRSGGRRRAARRGGGRPAPQRRARGRRPRQFRRR